MKRKFKRRLMSFVVITIFSLSLLLTLFSVFLRPPIIRASQSYAKNDVSQVIDSKVQKVMLDEFFSYEKIVVISRDSNGNVTSVSTNSTLINRFTNDLGISVGNELEEISMIKKHLYLSNMLGLNIFSGLGPKIPVRFCPLSVTNADISHTFEQAGINQTLHTVNLTVSVEMEILIPMAHSTLMIESTMPISQTLIVGTVPSTYLNRNLK